MNMSKAACTLTFLLSTAAFGQAAQQNRLVLKTEQDTRAFFHYTHKDVPIISAHRGGSDPGYPENTLLAFEHVLQTTPAIFETDPRVTSDGKLLVMHDETLDRTTMETGPVKARTLADLQTITMKDSVGKAIATHPPSLDELIRWAKGKTVLNLDIKDAPAQQRLDAVRKQNALGAVLFTVHSADEAKFFYQADHRSLLAAVIFSLEQMKSYEAAGIPWQNIAIGYVGTKSLSENKPLYDALHSKGIMVMVAAAPTYDKLPTVEERAAAYRKIINDGADILESDRPIEVAQAIKALYLPKSDRYRFWSSGK